MNRNLLGNLHQINGRFALIVVLLFCVLGAKAQSPTPITDEDGLNAMTTSGSYIINADIDASSFSTIPSFSGTLQADINPDTKMPYRIKNLNTPLFAKLTGTVKNLVIENVDISQEGVTGAIADTANGSARIYNVGILGGSVESTGNSTANNSNDCCGGLVGLLDGEARVVNCYNFADITDGNRVGGIVGYNNFETTSESNKLKTMVYSCMFYGDLPGGDTAGAVNKAPIYNGKLISNKDSNGVSNFNYFCSAPSYVQYRYINTYNCALAAEERFLQRFEFYRDLLNSHREVAAWWVNSTSPDPSEMMKWVMIPDSIGTDHPYPVLKVWGKYPSVVNYDAASAVTGKPRNQGGKLGTLAVHIQMGSGGAIYGSPTGASIIKSDTVLNITDKDTTHFNFNYYKVQLPYYNDVGTKNYTGNRVVTGWKIVSISGGTPGSFITSSEDAIYDANGNLTETPYNFADRHCTNKDLFSTSNRVFNQGAYWDVPEGVTAITIEPYWAKAAYVADAYADVVYNTAMKTAYNVPNVGGGELYLNGNSYNINGDSQKVYTNTNINNTFKSGIANAVSALNPGTNHTVNDNAVVLVGNYHQYNNIISNKTYTITAIDLDGDNEPDYSFMLRFDGRTQFHAVKYDFIHLVGLGMAQKSTGGWSTYNFGIPRPLGWFEVTNTALFRVTQLEYERSNRTAKPIILHGGVIEQWVSAQNDGNGNLTTYFHVGSNVWFKEFHLGCHQDRTLATKHPPVSVTGGDFDAFYLTGLYANADNYEDDAECYINGGRFGTVAGTGMEGIGNESTYAKGNITWLIDNADIKEFYAGGINAAKPAQGSIYTKISHSYVDFFCGGPKFGDMNSGRTVRTIADTCTFNLFFGAGYGGNSYYTAAPGNFTNVNTDPWNPGDDKGYNLDWDKWVRGEIKSQSTNSGNYSNGVTYRGYWRDYISQFGGVSTAIDYQFLPFSDNTYNVARLFLKFVKFTLATTRSVSSTLTGCTIDSCFYGGGSLGKVDGPVVSILDSCTVKCNVFGAGYSATLPEIPVMNTGGFKKQPYYNKDLGVYLPPILPDTVHYKWDHHDVVNETSNAIDETTHTLYTTEVLSKTNLGSVSGNVTLTLKGKTTVGTLLEDGTLKPKTGNVYGGGDQSAVNANTEVILRDGTNILGNVYGGGNEGRVSGDSKVFIQNEQNTTTEP